MCQNKLYSSEVDELLVNEVKWRLISMQQIVYIVSFFQW